MIFWSLLNPPKYPLLLSSFKIIKTVRDDTWNAKPGTEYYCKILTREPMPLWIGHFDYRASVGQVGRMYIDPLYQGRCLEEQVLVYMMRDMQDAGATHIWEVRPEENDAWDHKLFSKLWDFTYKPEDLHPSVTGGGYIMPIPKDPRHLCIGTNPAF